MPINTNPWNRLRYTLYAPLYDRVVRFQRPRRRFVGLLELRPGERVLVNGAGTGADLDFIPHGVEVVATDLTSAMVDRVRTGSAPPPPRGCAGNGRTSSRFPGRLI